MRLLLFTLHAFFIAKLSLAQITITSAMLPQLGDTLLIANDNLPADIEVGRPGADRNWDFTSLQTPFLSQSVVMPAAAAAAKDAFPAANIHSEIRLGEGAETGEAFFRSVDNSFLLLGYFGQDPAGLGIETLVQYDPPVPERRVPLRYGDKHESQTAATLTFSSNELSRAILDSLPIRPDSLRLRITSNRKDHVDAWGKLRLPGKGRGELYNVLREKRTEVREIRLDVQVGFLPWQDITDLLIGKLPNFGKQTLISYYFFSDAVKQPVAVVNMDPEGRSPVSVSYRGNDKTNRVRSIRPGRPDIFAYPNPAITEVRFEFTNLDAGQYSLRIYNILGVEVWKRDYTLNGSKTVKADISDLRKGTYLFNLVDEQGKTLATKRLMVIRP